MTTPAQNMHTYILRREPNATQFTLHDSAGNRLLIDLATQHVTLRQANGTTCPVSTESYNHLVEFLRIPSLPSVTSRDSNIQEVSVPRVPFALPETLVCLKPAPARR
jgi:hypothetical protein